MSQLYLHNIIRHTMSIESKSILDIFARNVKKRRNELGISQEKLAELAELSGLHRTYIGMIERSEKNITLLNIQKISKALNVEISTLLKEE